MGNPFEIKQYLTYYGLQEAPYSTNPDDRLHYFTTQHKDAYNMVGRIIENREGAGLIIGEQGTGKTTLMRRVTSVLKDEPGYHVAVVETAEHSPSLFQLTKEVLESFGLTCVGRDTQTRIDQLKQLLLDNYKNDITTVLLIDEAQQMKPKLLESLRGFLNFEDPRSGGKFLQIILFAMPSMKRKLAFAPSFKNRLMKILLETMTRQEMETVLSWRFYQAGGNQFPFDEIALNSLYECTGGNHRTVCGIAQLCLEEAAKMKKPITPKLIQAMAERRYV